MTTRGSLWEVISSGALASMGAAGIMSPLGLQNSTFFPAFRELAAPIVVALIVFCIGASRMVVILSFYRSKRARHVLAILSMAIWAQWALGLAMLTPTQGLRPGVMQNVWMAIGELMFIIFLMKGRWSGKPTR